MNTKLSVFSKFGLVLISFAIVGFGQPAWSPVLGLLAAAFGYTLFWIVLIAFPRAKERFVLGSFWFYSVQLVQYSWLVSHPYAYIFAAYLVLPFLLYGIPFGLICMLFNPNNILQKRMIVLIPALWTVCEWSRLFFLSGCTWNPVGLSLTCHEYPMQMASLFGVFGLSFWVMLVNFLAFRAWMQGFALRGVFLFFAFAFFPYFFGFAQYRLHYDNLKNSKVSLKVLLVQPAFPAEESLSICSNKRFTEFVLDEWREVLQILKNHQTKDADLVVLPEAMVPFGVYSLAFPHDEIVEAFKNNFGAEKLDKLPPLEPPYASLVKDGEKSVWMVNNAYIIQGIANCFNAGVVAGLEDTQDINDRREYYSAAKYFTPQNDAHNFSADRYAKRILVPLGEYIPFEYCKSLAQKYGVYGSFTKGEEAKVWNCGNVPFGVSICYEETFGDLMRENKEEGAQLLVNLTSDVWYPNSRLPKQHFDHSRIRTVEMGIPLIRACNTGITSACDSLGRVVSKLGESPQEQEWTSDALFATVPIYTYQTLYAQVGDGLVLGFSLFVILLFLRSKRDK